MSTTLLSLLPNHHPQMTKQSQLVRDKVALGGVGGMGSLLERTNRTDSIRAVNITR